MVGEELDSSRGCATEFVFFLGLIIIFIFHFILYIFSSKRVAHQKNQMIFFSLDCCYKHSGQSPDCWSSGNVQVKME